MKTRTEAESDSLRVAIAQIAPVWLRREQTLSKVVGSVVEAGERGCRLIAFGEALAPGYPFWIERTDGARFNSTIQKELHSHYMQEAVQIEAGHLQPVCAAAAEHGVAVYLGCIERAPDRGGHSLYCSLVYIDATGTVLSVHRKLMPTYEERLSWAPGDGHGLRVHPLGVFSVGGLNCWENWMPLARAALYGLGEDLHVSVWPGGVHNTADITRFIAKESRSYVIAASGLLRRGDIGSDLPHAALILEDCPEILSNGGSAIAGPDGSWVVEPVVDEEKLIVADLDHGQVRAERQNFDAAGHYSRPDVLQVRVNRARQRSISIVETNDPS